MKRLLIRILSKVLKINPYMMRKSFQVFKDDFKNEKRTSLSQKIWAYRRGFTSSKIIDYGLKEENYSKYLSDLDYYRLFPLNNHYVMWINDKLTTKYVLSKYNEHLPGYYFYLKNGDVLPSVDSLPKDELSAHSILDLLKTKGILAFKQESGSLGVGFYKVEYIENVIYVNGEISDEDKLINLIGSLDGYLVTEFLKAHEDIDNIHPGTANTLRLTVIKDGDQPAQLTNAFIRFGTSETKGVDNASAGGLFSIIDIEEGTFKTGHRFINRELVDYDIHPDTNVAIEALIPRWESTVDKVLEVADYIGQLSWLGFDVVITDDGFKILEINSHQDISWYQYYYPLLENNPASGFLKLKLKENHLAYSEHIVE